MLLALLRGGLILSVGAVWWFATMPVWLPGLLAVIALEAGGHQSDNEVWWLEQIAFGGFIFAEWAMRVHPR